MYVFNSNRHNKPFRTLLHIYSFPTVKWKPIWLGFFVWFIKPTYPTSSFTLQLFSFGAMPCKWNSNVKVIAKTTKRQATVNLWHKTQHKQGLLTYKHILLHLWHQPRCTYISIHLVIRLIWWWQIRLNVFRQGICTYFW